MDACSEKPLNVFKREKNVDLVEFHILFKVKISFSNWLITYSSFTNKLEESDVIFLLEIGYFTVGKKLSRKSKGKQLTINSSFSSTKIPGDNNKKISYFEVETHSSIII